MSDNQALIEEARQGQDGCEDCGLLTRLADAVEAAEAAKKKQVDKNVSLASVLIDVQRERLDLIDKTGALVVAVDVVLQDWEAGAADYPGPDEPNLTELRFCLNAYRGLIPGDNQ